MVLAIIGALILILVLVLVVRNRRRIDDINPEAGKDRFGNL
jgi:uncharacterized integral membrane protein